MEGVASVAVREGALVEVHGLGKTFLPLPRWARAFTRSPITRPVRALDGVSLRVSASEILAVAGRNGAGKSTLFRILTGLVTPTEGWARVCDYDAVKEAGSARPLIGFVPGDDRSLSLHLTTRENLKFRGRLHRLAAGRLNARIDEVLDVVDLTEQADNTGFALSSGMRARLQLACALLHEPPVLILDEPTASVDPVASHSLLETIRRLAREQQLAVLLSTHRADEIEALSDNVVLLDHGRVLHLGPLDLLRARHESGIVELTFDRTAAAQLAAGRLAALDGVDRVGVHGASVTLATSLSAGQLLTSLDGALGAVDAVQHHRLAVRDLLATVLADDATTSDS